ncbi:hypothetical protein ACCP88_01900 [Xanthomonas axonopodis pv. cyamopsidis]
MEARSGAAAAMCLGEQATGYRKLSREHRHPDNEDRRYAWRLRRERCGASPDRSPVAIVYIAPTADDIERRTITAVGEQGCCTGARFYKKLIRQAMQSLRVDAAMAVAPQ